MLNRTPATEHEHELTPDESRVVTSLEAVVDCDVGVSLATLDFPVQGAGIHFLYLHSLIMT